jgi:hypothetical protein
MDEVIKETIKERKEAKKISQEELKIIERTIRKNKMGILKNLIVRIKVTILT